MLKKIKSILTATLIGVLFIGLTPVNAMTASDVTNDVNNDLNIEESYVNIYDEILMYLEKGATLKTYSKTDEIVYIVEITDEEELKKIDKTGQGKLKSRTITYILPQENNLKTEFNKTEFVLMSTYNVGNWTYAGNKWYTPSEGVPFTIEGEAEFTHTVKTASTYQLYGEASGKVKGIVELKLGGEIGFAEEKEWEVSVSIPEGYYREFEIWEYKTKYTFDILEGDEVYSSGWAYKPNGGRYMTNDLYEKEK
ncbi:hypothetical protein JYG23_07185 [Sedimentibacter sp. zth1]|uniref:hypothetical protein n=1 Tax=Sedimentibacter sp. zth1 TaxID=2816908 RepID=UPI001A93595C|nr:hypothetical protein [Sedimentibacter sp. zth1]QSX07119.1 hypothetical protein JYG23_07185 [Sedimentibacter sp. zth1]